MKGKYSKPKNRGAGRKVLVLLAAMILTVCCTVGGTLAWLVADTGPVVNTFTYGDINLELWEHDYDPDNNTINTGGTPVTTNPDYVVLPGRNMPKDPYVVVDKDSEDCWLFIEVTETDWLTEKDGSGNTVRSDKLDWAIDDTVADNPVNDTKWEPLSSPTNVWYRKVLKTDTIKRFDILKGNQVTVSADLTKTDLKGVTAKPTLTFKAYACQLDNGTGDEFSATEAWAKVKPAP